MSLKDTMCDGYGLVEPSLDRAKDLVNKALLSLSEKELKELELNLREMNLDLEKLELETMDYVKKVDVPTSNKSPLHDIAEFAKDAAVIAGSAAAIYGIFKALKGDELATGTALEALSQPGVLGL